MFWGKTVKYIYLKYWPPGTTAFTISHVDYGYNLNFVWRVWGPRENWSVYCYLWLKRRVFQTSPCLRRRTTERWKELSLSFRSSGVRSPMQCSPGRFWQVFAKWLSIVILKNYLPEPSRIFQPYFLLTSIKGSAIANCPLWGFSLFLEGDD